MNKMYAVAFQATDFKGEAVFFKPTHIMGGRLNGDDFLDEFNQEYYSLESSAEIGEAHFFAFPVSEQELLKRISSDTEATDEEKIKVCAGLYLDSVKDFLYYVVPDEIDQEVDHCYMFDVMSGYADKIDQTQDFFASEPDVYEGYDFNDAMSKVPKKQEPKKEAETDTQSKMQPRKAEPFENIKFNTPAILKAVNKKVIGQPEAAKKFVYTLTKNIRDGDLPKMRSNILVYGPSGCGKTHLARNTAEELNVPFIEENMANYTANGYVGASVHEILWHLWLESGKDMRKAQRAVVFLDEFDKLASTDPRSTVNKTDVQEAILKMIEGSVVELRSGRGDPTDIWIDTKGISFVLSGAWSGLTNETLQKHQIGFGEEKNVPHTRIATADFIRSGIHPEVLRRAPVRIGINQLTEANLKQILEEQTLNAYVDVLSARYHTDLIYDDAVLTALVKKAQAIGGGASGLEGAVNDTMIEAMDAATMSKFKETNLIITANTVEDSSNFKLEKKKRRFDGKPIKGKTG